MPPKVPAAAAVRTGGTSEPERAAAAGTRAALVSVKWTFYASRPKTPTKAAPTQESLQPTAISDRKALSGK